MLLSYSNRLASVPLLPVFRLCLRRREREGGRGRGKREEEATQWLARLPLEFRSPPFLSTTLFALLGREVVKFKLS